jgi:Protein of unknown function (DUF1573)
MQKRLLVLGLMTLVFPAIVLAEAGPTIHFKSLEHDFGKVHHGESPSVEMAITNTGDETLKIRKLRSSCDCAHGVLGGRKIAPGETGIISARIKTHGLRVGPYRRSLFVHSNDPRRPVVKLSLHFDVIRNISIEPPFLAISLRERKETVSFTLKVKNHCDNPVVLKASSAAGKGNTIILQPEHVEVLPGRRAEFKMLVPVGKESRPGYCRGTAGIQTTDPKEPLIRLRYLIRLPKAIASGSGTDG